MRAETISDLPRLLGYNALAVFIALIGAEHDGIAPVSARWIVDHLPDRTSRNTVARSLHFLSRPEDQIAVKACDGWRLTSNEIQLPLSYLLPHEDTQMHSGSAFSISAMHSESASNDVVVVDANSKGPLSTITTTTTLTKDPMHSGSASRPGSDLDASQAACLKVLRQYGVFGKKAKEIASKPGMTTGKIRDHMEQAKRELHWDNPTGMAIMRLLEDMELPEQVRDEEEYRKYKNGKFAAWMVHDDDEESVDSG